MAIDIRTIDWGIGDTKQELKFGSEKFAARFVQLDDLKMINEPHHLFVWGGRGCGKSAISWKLAQDTKKDIVLVIDFEEEGEETAWVQNTLSRLNALSKISNFPTLKFITDVWYHSIFVEIMRYLLKKKLIGVFSGKDTLVRYVRKNNIQNKKLFETVTLMCEKANNILKKSNTITVDPMVQGALISAKGLLMLESYMTKNTDFRKAKNVILKFFSTEQAPNVRIIVDSVDKWLLGGWHPKAESEYLTLCDVVRGLTKALVKIYTNPKLNSKFMIKALLPRDMQNHIYDRATRHETIYHHHLHWSADELLAFIVKRINVAATEKNNGLMETWLDLFPDTIENQDTKVKHSSFDYLLRHSQYKPRELLLCCRRITEYAQKNKKSTITKREFAQIIHQHAMEEAKCAIQEYTLSYPKIYEAVHRLDGSSTIISRQDLLKCLHGAPLPPTANDYHDLIQFFYDIGILGVVLNENVMQGLGVFLPFSSRDNKTHFFAFKHYIPELSLSAMQRFAIHPMFYGFLGVSKSKLTVNQIEPTVKIYRDYFLS